MQASLRTQHGCVQSSTSATRRPTAVCLGVSSRAVRSRPRSVFVQAKEKRTTGNAAIDNALDVGNGLVESAANLVPDSVPRGVAKGGVAVAGVVVAFWLLQKLVSTVLTIALLGGAAWFYFQYGGNSSSSSSGSGSKGTSKDSDVDLNDPLAEARRIMDKYKK